MTCMSVNVTDGHRSNPLLTFPHSCVLAAEPLLGQHDAFGHMDRNTSDGEGQNSHCHSHLSAHRLLMPGQVFRMLNSHGVHCLMEKLPEQNLALLQAVTARLYLHASFKLILFGLQPFYPCMYIVHPGESHLGLSCLTFL